MKRIFNTNAVLTAVILISLFILSGCQPEGGELLPIGGEGITLASSRFENDTAVINDNGLKIKLYGTWDGRAKVRVIIENNTSNVVKFDFKRSKILDSKGDNVNIDSIYEDKGDGINEIKDGQFSAAADGKHKLVIGFPLNLMSSLSEEPPRTISVVLATQTDSKTNQSREYKVNFKGIESQVSAGKTDPKDW